MDTFFSMSSRENVQILAVHNLLNELANREIMLAVETRMAEGFTDFIVDLSAVDYMNSVGINFLIQMKRRSGESGGGLAVVNASGKVKQLLEITKLRPMFFLSDSVETALKHIKDQR